MQAKKIAKGKTSKEEIDEIMLKIKYIDFVNNYGYILNFDSFEENILNQICEHIDEYKNKAIFKRNILCFNTDKYAKDIFSSSGSSTGRCSSTSILIG